MSDEPEEQQAAYWKARCRALEAGVDTKSVDAARQLVNAALSMSRASGMSFAGVVDSLLRATQVAKMGGPKR